MGNCCKPASSMEWDGENWGSLKSRNNTTTRTIPKRSSNKVFDESHDDNGLTLTLGKVQKEKLLQRACPVGDGKVKLRISKKELAELLLGSGIENNQIQGGQASAEQALFRLMNRANANKPQGPWKPVLDCIPESPKVT